MTTKHSHHPALVPQKLVLYIAAGNQSPSQLLLIYNKIQVSIKDSLLINVLANPCKTLYQYILPIYIITHRTDTCSDSSREKKNQRIRKGKEENNTGYINFHTRFDYKLMAF